MITFSQISSKYHRLLMPFLILDQSKSFGSWVKKYKSALKSRLKSISKSFGPDQNIGFGWCHGKNELSLLKNHVVAYQNANRLTTSPPGSAVVVIYFTHTHHCLNVLIFIILDLYIYTSKKLLVRSISRWLSIGINMVRRTVHWLALAQCRAKISSYVALPRPT